MSNQSGAIIAGRELARLAREFGEPEGMCVGCVFRAGTRANTNDRATDVAWEAALRGLPFVCPINGEICAGQVSASANWRANCQRPNQVWRSKMLDRSAKIDA